MLYPFTELPQDQQRVLEHTNRIIKGADISAYGDAYAEKFFNCRLENCNFYSDQLTSVVFMNCHFQNCTFTTYNEEGARGRLPFSNTTFLSCSFSECLFDGFTESYGNLTDCTMKLCRIQNSKMEAFHLVNLNMIECVIKNLSLRHATAPLFYLRGCTSDGLDLRDAKIGTITFQGGSYENSDFSNAQVLQMKFVRAEGDFERLMPSADCTLPDFFIR